MRILLPRSQMVKTSFNAIRHGITEMTRGRRTATQASAEVKRIEDIIKLNSGAPLSSYEKGNLYLSIFADIEAQENVPVNERFIQSAKHSRKVPRNQLRKVRPRCSIYSA